MHASSASGLVSAAIPEFISPGTTSSRACYFENIANAKEGTEKDIFERHCTDQAPHPAIAGLHYDVPELQLYSELRTAKLCERTIDKEYWPIASGFRVGNLSVSMLL